MATASKRKQAGLGIQPSSKVTSPATADKLHVATRSDNVHLGSVLVLIRKSGHRTDKHLCQKDYDLAKEFATSYVRTHKASHINCNCKPEAHCIFANGVSSNLDISTLHQMGINQLRITLDELLSRDANRSWPNRAHYFAERWLDHQCARLSTFL